MPEVSIIIPTYNEKHNIQPLLSRIHESIKDNYEMIIVIVDDNSPDKTADIIKKEFINRYPLKLIVRESKKGLASAVVEGFKCAEGNIFVVMDADLQHAPEKIKYLICEVNNGSDIAIANRYGDKEGFKGLSVGREIISKWANYPVKLLFRKLNGINDIQSGFFAIKKDVIKNVELRPKGYKILLEILILGNYKNIKEIPFKLDRRMYGETKLGIKTIFDYISHIAILAIRTGEAKRFLKYCTVGVIGIGINTGILFLFTGMIGIYYMISSFLAHEISILSNFVMNDHWTFKEYIKKEDNLIYRAFRYNMAKVTGVIVSITFLYVYTEFLGMNYLVSNIMSIMTGVFWGYMTSLTVVWRK